MKKFKYAIINLFIYIFQAIFIKYLYARKNQILSSCSICLSKNINFFYSYKYKYTVIKISRCNNCNYIFQNPRLSDRGLLTFYKLVYRPFKSKTSYSSMFMREKRRGEYIYAFICEFINDKKINVLEFGCGSGGILDTLKNKTKSEVIGIDLDKQAVSFGKQKGINLLSVDLDNLKDNKFDLIIASHVMEHLDNPQVTLGKLAELLNDGGYIYIEVPGVENKKVIESNYSIQPGHLSYFNLDIILKISNKINLNSVKSNNKIQVLLKKT